MFHCRPHAREGSAQCQHQKRVIFRVSTQPGNRPYWEAHAPLWPHLARPIGAHTTLLHFATAANTNRPLFAAFVKNKKTRATICCWNLPKKPPGGQKPRWRAPGAGAPNRRNVYNKYRLPASCVGIPTPPQGAGAAAAFRGPHLMHFRLPEPFQLNSSHGAQTRPNLCYFLCRRAHYGSRAHSRSAPTAMPRNGHADRLLDAAAGRRLLDVSGILGRSTNCIASTELLRQAAMPTAAELPRPPAAQSPAQGSGQRSGRPSSSRMPRPPAQTPCGAAARGRRPDRPEHRMWH